MVRYIGDGEVGDGEVGDGGGNIDDDEEEQEEEKDPKLCLSSRQS